MREIVISVLVFFAKAKYRKIERLTRGLTNRDREAILDLTEFEINYELSHKVYKVNKIALWTNKYCGYSCGLAAILFYLGENPDGSPNFLGLVMALLLGAVTLYIFKVRVPRLESKVRRAES